MDPRDGVTVGGHPVRWSPRGYWVYGDGSVAGSFLDCDLAQQILAAGFWGEGFRHEWMRRRRRPNDKETPT